MKTGKLLELLIAIAQIAKTDFALNMNMTPSGLSKILTGKRLPFSKEKHPFSVQAAKILTDAIFGPNCYLKLADVFPVIYDFSSKLEMEQFLTQAIEYTLDQDFSAENGESMDYPDKEACYLGKKPVLNMFCTVLSELVRATGGMCPDFYSALPILNPQYADIFGRLKLCCPDQARIVLNQYFQLAMLETALSDFNLGTLSRLVDLENYFDLNLWQVETPIPYPFLLAKGQFLLLLSTQLDGSPILTLIKHKSYLAVFYNALIKSPVEKMSFSTKEAGAFLDAHPAFLDELAEQGVDSVYNALSIGYMLEQSDLPASQAGIPAATRILGLFKHILKSDTVFHVTIDAMLNIALTGMAVMPLVGAVELLPQQRVPYLQRFQAHVDERSASKVKIINGELPKAAVLCARGLALIYVANSACTHEKIHCLNTNKIRPLLDSELTRHEITTLSFSMDLWDAYINEISRNLSN